MIATLHACALPLFIALVQVPAAVAAPLAMPPAVDGTPTLAKRTAPVARCAGRAEDCCRVRSYCWWIAGTTLVPGHCKMRNRRWAL